MLDFVSSFEIYACVMEHDTSIAAGVIAKLGGADVVATLIGRSKTAVYRWTYPKNRGGTDGLVPAQYQQLLLNHARANNIDLTPADFFKKQENAA